jgi:hypothetical protein
MPHFKAGDKMMVGDPSQPRSQWKEHVVLKPFYVMRGEPSEPSVSAREYTVVIAVSFDGGITHEPLSKIHLTATQAAELLKEGVVRREGCTSARTRRRVRLSI